jgi:two-component system secretion sensor histidine kinase SsrA
MKTMRAFSVTYPLDILIADSHSEERAAATEILSQLGYRPSIAVSSRDVLMMTSSQKYDLILMDMRMPGLDTVLHTPVSQPGARPIIIAMTGVTKPGAEEACLQAMADHSLDWPIEKDELLLQLKACAVLTGKCRIRQ